jgi:cobalt-zinc-cadmium resistance protein CzcA
LLNWVIDFSLRHRFFVLLGVAAVAAVGVFSLFNLNIDAFPDTTPVMVQINTVVPALGPEEAERQITIPIEQALGGMPRLEGMRSISKFGLSQVVVTFEDGTDIYFARQVVNERLLSVELPQGSPRPELGPVSTGLGEVINYMVTGKGDDVTSLRTIHDWVIKPKLRTAKGTAEVNSWGGFEKQYQVRLDPTRLVKYGLTFDEVVAAVQKNNLNVGGGSIRQADGMLLVQGVGRTGTIDEIKNVAVAAKDGVPVRVGDLGDVQIGHEIRRGAVTFDGKGEAVMGLGFMLMGENSHEVTWNLKNKLEEIKTTLPPGVKVQPVYDRTELVDFVIDTVRVNLLEGGLFVIAVLFLFLGNLRASLIVAAAIPLSMLFAFMGMYRFGIAASLLSLGAIDFGMVVDSSVVMVENCVRCLAHSPGRDPLQVVREAAVEVRKPTMFGELIIMIVYLPILTLEGVEGKMFRPMALTVIFALAGSMLLSLTLMPVLASLVLPQGRKKPSPWWARLARRAGAVVVLSALAVGVYAVSRSPVLAGGSLLVLTGLWLAADEGEREPFLMRVVKLAYTPLLKAIMRFKFAVVAFAACVLVTAFVFIAPNLGSEFVPKLSEGAVCINITRLAGTDLDQAVRYNTRMEKAVLAAFPDEVEHVWSRAGTAEVATDPMGVELTDFFITLKPREQWKKAATQDELTELIEKEVHDLPGQHLSFTQPIAMRLDEMVSGVKAQVAVKVFGDDLDELKKKADAVAEVLQSIKGNADVSAEQITGQPMLRVAVRQDEIARYGVSAKAVLDLVESVGSVKLGEVMEGQLRFPLVIRLPEKDRATPESIGALLVATPAGERIPLSRLADLTVETGPSTITREWGQRRATVTCNIKGRDMGGFVAEAQRKVAQKVPLPSGGRYHIGWGGQFESLQRARTRLLIVVPLAIVLVFGLLYLTYNNVADALRVLTGVPFAWVGGVVALWLRGMPFSISAGVGFIALSGVAVLGDMILVSYIRQLRDKGLPLEEAVEQAAQTRLRPVLMTTLVACLGFVPMALSTGMGSEVQRPLATVVIGGVLSAMVMSLLVLRVLYVLFKAPGTTEAAKPQGRTEQIETGERVVSV